MNRRVPYEMKILLVQFVVLCCIAELVWGQSTCKVPPAENMVGDSLPKEVNDAVHMGSYPSVRIARLRRSNKKEFKEAESTLEFCHAREEKFRIPDLPETLVASQTCQITDRQISIPERVNLQGARCWVLRPWAGKRCTYVNCESDDCTVPPDNSVPVPDQFKCRSTNPRHVKVYALCVEEGQYEQRKRYDLKSFTIRLPQCCSCVRFQCLFKG